MGHCKNAKKGIDMGLGNEEKRIVRGSMMCMVDRRGKGENCSKGVMFLA